MATPNARSSNPNRLKLLLTTALTIVIFLSGLTHAEVTLSKQENNQSLNELLALQQQLEKTEIPGLIESKVVTINGHDLPWTDTKITLKKGNYVTFLIDGKLDFGGGITPEPGISFWAGFGKRKPMFVAGQNTQTLEIPNNGNLFIARSLSEWQSPKGELSTPVEYYQSVKGRIHALIIEWDSDPREGLHNLVNTGINHPLIPVELQRLKSPSLVPEGWYNMWLFGNNGIFKENPNDQSQIDVFTHRDVGILQKDVSYPLSPDLNISWEWIVDQLPSPLPEDKAHTHDYLSIAVEFDDGQDLTYMWSNGLSEGKHFRCPLPRWTDIETHYVLRSDPKQLGKWLKEKRNVYSDYKTTIGGDAKRVTRIWFIANTVFQSGFGKASFKNIQFKNE